MSDLPQVTLRDVEDDDLGALFEQQNDEGAQWMAAFIAGREPGDRDAFDRHWTRIRADPTITIQTVLAGLTIVGYTISFAFEGQREAGYWIGRAFWGRGFATAALAEFLTIERTRPLSARIAADNSGSRKVLERNGFVMIGEEISFAPARHMDIRELIFELS